MYRLFLRVALLAVLSAIDQVDTNRRIQDQPVRAGTAPQVGVTAARDAVSALSDLLNAQNDFLSVWVNYEVLRRVLDRDLGTMQLDPDGNWIDPGELGAESGFILPADCDDCQLEAQILGGLIPNGAGSPLDANAETIPTPNPAEEIPTP